MGVMSKLGFVVLAHENLHRTKSLVEYLHAFGCPVAIHVDARVDHDAAERLQSDLKSLKKIHFTKRFASEWGGFGLVRASLTAGEQLIKAHSDLSHVMLISGSCLPIRPVNQLLKFLSKKQGTDFIESVDLSSQTWVQDGLNEERFDFYFPISWKKNRWLFDVFTSLQRRLNVKRARPVGLPIYLGSQWWCLTRTTLRKIINDPERAKYDRYFKRSWIPDESYFQTLARRHSERLEARSLTWAKFDDEGKPFTIYSDHVQAIENTNCFFMRKVWAKDDALYARLLNQNRDPILISRSQDQKQSDPFSRALAAASPNMGGRFNAGSFAGYKLDQRNKAAFPYTVVFGPQSIFKNLDDWIEERADVEVQSDLFDRRKMTMRGKENFDRGNLPINKLVRNNAPKHFLHNFIWNQREHRQVLFFDAQDSRKCFEPILRDPNATIYYLRNSWIVEFEKLAQTGADIRSKAQQLQRMEEVFAKQFSKFKCRAKVRTFDLVEILRDPFELLHSLLENLEAPKKSALTLPEMIDASNLLRTIERLKNEGLAIDSATQIVKSDHTTPAGRVAIVKK